MRVREVDEVFLKAVEEGRNFLLEHEAKKICSLYGMPVTKVIPSKSKEEALDAARSIGFPVVLKIISPQILHKSDVGGVIVGIDDETELISSYRKIIRNVKDRMPEAEITGVLVQEMVPHSTELIVGSTYDPTFGPTIMFGVGGIFVEILEDVSFRLIPITEDDAWEMVNEIKAYKILDGFRGNPPVDKKSIIDVLLKTSAMVCECPEIRELDLNPIMASSDGIIILDARIILQ
jgi:acetyl-CoA synthetase (ADP-forming)